MQLQMHTHDLNHLRNLALSVQQRTDYQAMRFAQAMTGAMRAATLVHGGETARRAMALLATGAVETWAVHLRKAAEIGYEQSIRAAFAFWAVETDPAVWATVASGS